MNSSGSYRSSSTNSQGNGSQSTTIAEGPTGPESAELLRDIVNSRPRLEDEDITGDPDEFLEGDVGLTNKTNINVRRLLAIMPLLTIAASVTMGPRIEVYTLLACSVERPDIFDLNRSPESPLLPYISAGLSPSYTDVALKLTYQTQSTSTIEIYTSNQSLDTIHVNNSQPDQRTRCASDPVVKTSVAKLTVAIAACTGFLMCLTTGWWGSFSDRHGRKSVMVVSTLSLLITDLNFILAASFPKSVPGGYWFLMIGPVADGIFGGMTIGIIVIQSYIADTTSESERSGAFSFALGILFSGMALGPTLGSLFIHFTGSLISVFYLSAVLHGLYAICVEVIVPESLSRQQMDDSSLKYRSGGAVVATQDDQRLFIYLLRLKSVFAFLTPLAIFFPIHAKNGNPLKRAQRDWSLTVVIVGYSLTYCVVGSYSYKFQYAISTFGWSSEELGYWFSVIGASRAVYLALILPGIIRIFKPKPPIQPNIDVSTNLTSSETIDEVPSSSSTPLLPKATKNDAHSSTFDLNLAKYSLLVEMIAFAGMGLSRTSLPFSIFGAISALGAGFGPTTEAIILTLYTRRGDTEKGKLLGAVGVVQAICSQIIGPAVFGLVYMKTVATHPRTIFLTTVITVIAAFFLLSLVRLPKESDSEQGLMENSEEQDSSVGEYLD